MNLDMSNRSENGRVATGDTANISAWLVKEGLRGATQTALLQGFCERLVAAGIPLQRAHAAQRALHPVFGAVGFDWHREGGRATREDYARVSEPHERWLTSPFYYMLQKGMSELRERLFDGNEPSRFPVLEEFRAQGASDYFASAMFFGQATIGPGTDPDDPPEGMISSWTSDAPQGFSDSDIGAIRELLPVLGLALKSASSYRTAHDLLAVYLGRDAGERVLSGDIQRGSLDTIRAVIWYFDLQGFTKLAETTPGDQMIAMLNDYFGAVVGAVEAYGGDVLKFMGDGLLAIFKFTDDDSACCSRAIAAADELLGTMATINDRRGAEDLILANFSLALHLGNVMYGNIGAEDRLDFTVIGPAVNMAARIQAMCRPLEQVLLISSAMAGSAVRERKRIVSIGRYVLRGIPEPQELFTLVAPEYAAK
jgi:adenylate cyclase